MSARLVRAGARPLHVLAVAVGLAVLREGSELVLFLYGVVAANGTTLAQSSAGFALGVVAGAGVGALLYFGLLRIPLRHLFTVTSWLILLLAAGMAAQGAAFLMQADLLPALGDTVWDTSHILPDTSLLGQMLHALIGYVAQPAGIQVVFYVATITLMGALMWLVGRDGSGVHRRAGLPPPSGGIVPDPIAAAAKVQYLSPRSMREAG